MNANKAIAAWGLISVLLTFSPREFACADEPDAIGFIDAVPAVAPSLADQASASDAIVLAKLESSKTVPLETLLGDANEAKRLSSYSGASSTFSVVTVLKGPHATNKITVAHIAMKEDVFYLRKVDAPRFLKTMNVPTYIISEAGNSYTVNADKMTTIEPCYLLFVKARGDGTYELTAGFENGAASVLLTGRTPP